MNIYKKITTIFVSVILLFSSLSLSITADENNIPAYWDNALSSATEEFITPAFSDAFLPDGTIVNSYFGIIAGDTSPMVAKQNVTGFTNAIAQASTLGLSNIKVESNTYYVDTSHTYFGNVVNSQNSIFLASEMNLNLNGATFRQIANDKQGYAIFAIRECDNVSIFGGTLIGDRDIHDYSPSSNIWGNSHEWGFGVSVQGSTNVTINGLNISSMTGDGVHVGGSKRLSMGGQLSQNIQIDNCSIYNCRRQGISVVGADTMEISNCRFADIDGIAPGYFIDLESSMDWSIRNIYIHNNQFGVASSTEKEVDNDAILIHQGTSDVSITDNQIEGNILFCYGQNVKITDNLINGIIGFDTMADSKQAVIKGNWGQLVIQDKSPSAKQIESFFVGGIKAWSINHTTGEITVIVPQNINLDSLTTKITVSNNASVSPSSGTIQDFTNPVTYTVKDSSGNAKQYIVTAYHEPYYGKPSVLSDEHLYLNLDNDITAQSFGVFLASGAKCADYATISSSDNNVAIVSSTKITQHDMIMVFGRSNGNAIITVRFYNSSGEMAAYRSEIPVTVVNNHAAYLSE